MDAQSTQIAVAVVVGAVIVALVYCTCCCKRRETNKPALSAATAEPSVSKPTIDYRDVRDYTQRIRGLLSGKEPGLAIIVGMSDAVGAELDTTNMERAFSKSEGHLGFAVLKEVDISSAKLLALVEAASSFPYVNEQRSRNVQVIAFYYAGHGGSDPSNSKPFVVAKGSSFVSIESIVSPFYPANTVQSMNESVKRLFFFDMCLSETSNIKISDHSTKPIGTIELNVPTRGNCLVACATSLDDVSGGSRRNGGYWTRHLHENIVKDMDIFEMLALTYEQTIQFTEYLKQETGSLMIQGPSLNACMGRFNLRCLSDGNVNQGTNTSATNTLLAARPPGRRSKTAETDDSNIDSNEDVHPTLPSKFTSVPNSELYAKHLGQVLNELGTITTWKRLGINLGLLETTISAISDQERDRVDRCTSEMLSAWFKWKDNVLSPEYGKPSWRRLLEALEPIDLQLATKIEQSKPWISKRK